MAFLMQVCPINSFEEQTLIFYLVMDDFNEYLLLDSSVTDLRTWGLRMDIRDSRNMKRLENIWNIYSNGPK